MGEAGEPAVAEGVKGTWRVDPSLLGQPFSGRAALLSPFEQALVEYLLGFPLAEGLPTIPAGDGRYAAPTGEGRITFLP